MKPTSLVEDWLWSKGLPYRSYLSLSLSMFQVHQWSSTRLSSTAVYRVADAKISGWPLVAVLPNQTKPLEPDLHKVHGKIATKTRSLTSNLKQKCIWSEVDWRISISMTSRGSLKFSHQRCKQTLQCDTQLQAYERDTESEIEKWRKDSNYTWILWGKLSQNSRLGITWKKEESGKQGYIRMVVEI